MYKSVATVVAVNDEKIPLRRKRILLPLNNMTGDYELVSDLSDLFKDDDFKSLEVLILDPLSADYYYYEGITPISYSYERESKVKVESAYINFLAGDKKIIGQVEELPDTNLSFYDFRSISAGYIGRVYKPSVRTDSCHINLKRLLINFSAEDSIFNNSPFFTKTPNKESGSNLRQGLTVRLDSVCNFQFKAIDPDGDEIFYHLLNDNGLDARIDEKSGLFSFIPDTLGEFFFTIMVSDSICSVLSSFKVIVVPNETKEPVFRRLPVAGELTINIGEFLFYSFNVIDEDIGYDLTWYEIVEAQIPAGDFHLSSSSGSFYFYGSKQGSYPFKIRVISQGDTIYHKFTVVVSPPNSAFDLENDAFKVDIYPNPSLSAITIELDLLKLSDVHFMLYDISGNLIDEMFYQNILPGKNKLRYDNSHLKRGVYIGQLRLSNDLMKAFKMIKK